jgi:predicted DNA-binding transcriptional regulator AlpA
MIARCRQESRNVEDCSQVTQTPTIAVMERQAHHDDDMLSRVELAAALNISTRTVDRWIAEGTGPPYVRLPRGMLRWRWGDVQAWLAERREGG